MVPHIAPVPLEVGRTLINQGRAVCAMKGQHRTYWPTDPLDEELRLLLMEEYEARTAQR